MLTTLFLVSSSLNFVCMYAITGVPRLNLANKSAVSRIRFVNVLSSMSLGNGRFFSSFHLCM